MNNQHFVSRSPAEPGNARNGGSASYYLLMMDTLEGSASRLGFPGSAGEPEKTNQQPTTNNQQPTTNNQQPTTTLFTFLQLFNRGNQGDNIFLGEKLGWFW